MHALVDEEEEEEGPTEASSPPPPVWDGRSLSPVETHGGQRNECCRVVELLGF